MPHARSLRDRQGRSRGQRASDRLTEIAENIFTTPASTIEGELRLSCVVYQPDVLAALTDGIVAITGSPIDFLR
jgi:hypothetical protein